MNFSIHPRVPLKLQNVRIKNGAFDFRLHAVFHAFQFSVDDSDVRVPVIRWLRKKSLDLLISISQKSV